MSRSEQLSKLCARTLIQHSDAECSAIGDINTAVIFLANKMISTL